MLRRGEASRVSALFFLTPPLAAVIAWLVLGEDLPPAAWPGMVRRGGRRRARYALQIRSSRPRDRLQLVALVVEGDAVAHDRRGEAALRPHRQALEVDQLGGVADAGSSSSSVSARGVLVVISPSTTIRSSGTWRSGSNPPERSSSYSSRSRCA